ncbi:MAG: hypothetical protein JWL73_1820 [Actinomycetia bacterium]|nr:hypothetical protein [Actinomycetes bacterium]
MRALKGLAPIVLVGALVVGLTAGAAGAGAVRVLQTPDTDFLSATAQTGLAQRQLDTKAKSEASAAAVRKFAGSALSHRRSIDKSLAKLARSKAFTLPTTVSTQDTDKMATVAVATGAQFDLAYAQLQRSMYARVVRDFRTEIQVGRNKDVVAFAKVHLKTLESDRTKATALAKKLAQGTPADTHTGTDCSASGGSGAGVNPSGGGSGGSAGSNGTGSGGTATGATQPPAASGSGSGTGGVAGCSAGSGSGSNASGSGNNG